MATTISEGDMRVHRSQVRQRLRCQERNGVFAAVAVALLVTFHGRLDAQTVWRSSACDVTHTFNETYSFSYTSGTYYTSGIAFTFGSGDLSAVDYGLENGRYNFAMIVDPSGVYSLDGPYIDVSDCLQEGSYGPPRIPGDTDWVDVYLQAGDGGTVSPIYRAEGATCDGITEIEYDPNDPPEDCNGGGGGPDGGVEVCVYIVLTDAYGDLILDQYGDMIVLEDLGCSDQ